MAGPDTDNSVTDNSVSDDSIADDSITDDAQPSRADVVDVTAEIADEDVDNLRGLEHGRDATNPLDIPARGWRDIALRVKDEWGDDNVGMAAAAVAFYSFLALIPALAALVSILGLVARDGNAQDIIERLFGALPDDAQQLLTDQLEAISESSSSSLSFGLALGLVLSVWTASGAIGQLMNTINIAYDEEETRSWFRRKAVALGLTFGAIVYVAGAIFLVVALPRIIEASALGVGLRQFLNIMIWPALAISFMAALALLYRIGPDRSAARWRWVSVGSIFAVVAWVVVTLGFQIYVNQFGSYNKTYGSLAGVIVALLWLWLTAVIVLLGAEINAEMEHQTARDSTVGGDQPMGERGAVKADTLGDLKR